MGLMSETQKYRVEVVIGGDEVQARNTTPAALRDEIASGRLEQTLGKRYSQSEKDAACKCLDRMEQMRESGTHSGYLRDEDAV